MMTGLGSTVVRSLRTAPLLETAALTDGQLLQSFLAQREEAAFEALVRRHGRMVLAVCHRVLGNVHDAEDAFQTSFLVLVRKGQSLASQDTIANWLYGVAQRTALKARASAITRRLKESQVQPPAESAALAPHDWDELRTVLDRELSRLPNTFREAVVLCDLEGRTRREAARQLGVPEGTLSGRLTTARRLLARRLARQGFALAGGMVATVCTGDMVAAAVPRSLVVATVRVAALQTSQATAMAVALTRLASLTCGAFQGWRWTRLQGFAALALIVGMAGIGIGAFPRSFSSPDEPRAGPSPPVPVPRLEAKSDAERMAGAWVFDAASQNGMSQLARVWTSKLTVSGNAFSLSKLMGISQDVKGTFQLNPKTTPKQIDLKMEGIDLSEAGAPLKIPACTVPGIYQVVGDRLTVCFDTQGGGQRPTRFEASGSSVVLLTVVRAEPAFKQFPKEVTVRVCGPDGKPAAGVTIAGFMSMHGIAKDAKREWKYAESMQTAADGTAKVPYDKLQFYALMACDPAHQRMAIRAVSPAMLLAGETGLTLAPACRLSGTIVCDELKKAGKPMSWTNVYLMQAGHRVADCDSAEGRFEFLVPPGTYMLYAYGGEFQKKQVSVTVPAGVAEFVADPIPLAASRLVMLRGQPAPELEGVIGWRGAPMKLADLRGKHVLLEFWGYWCGPCIASMPTLLELHEKFADKGLAIVGIHVDVGDDVDTAARLDEKIDGFKKQYWKGKDLPFPVALASGKRIGQGETQTIGGPVAQYGVLHFPTTILIDPKGQVVGEFQAHDAKAATEQMEKLLKESR